MSARFPWQSRFVLAGLVGSTVVLGGTVRAGTPDDFYRGKTLTLLVSADAGTGYDISARTIARHMSEHLSGTPNVIVQNMAGAGGMTATNYLYNVAPKDGLTFGLIQATVPFEPLYENKQAAFDSLKFNWLGTPGQETSTLIVWHTVPVNSLADARSRGLTLGATGAASTPAFFAHVITALFGIPINLIIGYKSQNEAFFAMERGENEGYPSSYFSSIKATHPDWLADKKLKILLQYGSEPAPELADVPFAADVLTNDDDKRLMQIAAAPQALGRPMLAPPAIPADRLAELRTALEATFRDPAYIADCAKQGIACDRPLSGAQVADILAKSYAAPATIRKRLQDIYGVAR
jgi:tripartite-type tricarboxylate transporter receptor subunit TctC